MSKSTGAAITDELIDKVQKGSAQMTDAKAIALAGELYSRGRHRQAINVVRQVIEQRPNHSDAHNILGVSLDAIGKTKEGIAALQRAIKLSPTTSSYRANLGEIYRGDGNLDDASVELTEALRLEPKNAQAQNNLGIVHYERKDYDKAVQCYRKALDVAPAMAEAWNNLGNSLRLVDDLEGARNAYDNALSAREHYPEAYNNLGTLLRELGKSDQAESALRKAIAQDPKYVDAYNNLATIYHGEGEDVEALRQLAEVLKFEPNNPKTLLLVGRVQLKRGAYDLAEQACAMVLRDDPKSADALTTIAQIKHETDDYDTALKLMESAVKIDPDNAEARNFYGVTLKSLGRLDEAREQILKAIELNDQMYGSYANLNDLIKVKKSDPLFKKIEILLKKETDPTALRTLPLHFAYAKCLEDIGDHPGALGHYITGGKLKRTQVKYVEEETFSFFDRIRAAFPAEIFAKRPFIGNQSERPVFIVGMPRSGSTLVEQILASHSQVFGAGEVKYLSREMHALRDRFPSLSRYPELVEEMNPKQYELLADNYLKSLTSNSSDSARVTDKLLTNYFFVGLIYLMFPNAKIINTRRNPIDNCLSAFTKLFKDDMPHSYDLGEIGRYYRKYEEIMTHWQKVLPAGVLMTLQYEDMVEDTEKHAKELITFLELPWDKACLEFHSSARPVKTASVAQVRKPIYKHAVKRWEKYGAGLEPLIQALGASAP
jgi:tetratricopeptide (TPR) repeat protein